MSLDIAILGFLNVESDTGYDLKTRRFDSEVPHLWSADQAQIYRTLDRLESAHLVSTKVEAQTDRPNRKIHSITRTGREALAAMLEVPAPLPSVRDPLLLRLHFGEHVDDEHLVELLRTRRVEHQQRLDSLRTRIATWSKDVGATPTRAQTLQRMALDGAVAHERASIDWLDDCVDILDDGPGSSARDTGDPGGQRRLFGVPSPEAGGPS